MTLELISYATDYCIKAHNGQIRKFSGKPYHIHPINVAEIVSSIPNYNDYVTISVALLHDVIEDSDATRLDLERIFGYEVSEGVNILSRNTVEKVIGKTSEQAYNDRLWQAKDYIQVIKIADVIDNTSDLHLQSTSSAQKKIDDIRNLYLPMAQKLNSSLEMMLLNNVENYYTKVGYVN